MPPAPLPAQFTSEALSVLVSLTYTITDARHDIRRSKNCICKVLMIGTSIYHILQLATKCRSVASELPSAQLRGDPAPTRLGTARRAVADTMCAVKSARSTLTGLDLACKQCCSMFVHHPVICCSEVRCSLRPQLGRIA